MIGLATIARWFAAAALTAVALLIGADVAIRMTPVPDVQRATSFSQVVTSSSGSILWSFLSKDDKWRLPVSLADVDPVYVRMLVAYEDTRFYSHHGVDWLALARAAYQLVHHRRVVSGGSTLSMQVVRMLEPRPRSLGTKIEQIMKALRLEREHSKQDILGLYLTLAPFGGNIEGIRAASLIYFGKEPKRLARSEAALLTAVPQSPEARRPDRHPATAEIAKNRVLSVLSRDAAPKHVAARQLGVLAGVKLSPLAQNAPHLAMRLRVTASVQEADAIVTLVDRNLQRQVERIVTRALAAWSDGVSIAVVVLRNSDSAVRAYVGGAFGENTRGGYIDLAQSVRSPGSALKPFIYGMAFEKLIVHPDTIITDELVEFEGYRPQNSDGRFSGDISIRTALIQSRNTTAVMLLDKVGIGALLSRVRSTGRPFVLPSSDNAAGLAIALGGIGVTLEQLTWFYTTFPNDGRLNAIRLKSSDPVRPLGRFFAPSAARAVADILGDVPPPPGYARQKAADGGRRIGFKTGTSYGFRDAWAVGFDRLHTVGVWLGRPDGSSHLGAYGATAAAPILMQVFDGLPLPDRDVGATSAELGALTSDRELPDRLHRFIKQQEGRERPLKIVFPRSGEIVRTDRSTADTVELPLIAQGGSPPYRWTVAGAELPPTSQPASRAPTNERGQVDISVVDSTGAIAMSSFWLE